MDYFKGTDAYERFNNALIDEMRKTNTLLEQLVQLLQPKIENTPVKTIALPKKTTQKKPNQRRKIS